MFLMVFLQEGLKCVQVRGNSFWRDTVVLEVFFYEEMKIDLWKYSFFQFLSPCVPECGDVSGDCFFDVVGTGIEVGRCDWGRG